MIIVYGGTVNWSTAYAGEREHADLDLMFAYNHHRNNGWLYLGKWNDGFVEENEQIL